MNSTLVAAVDARRGAAKAAKLGSTTKGLVPATSSKANVDATALVKAAKEPRPEAKGVDRPRAKARKAV